MMGFICFGVITSLYNEDFDCDLKMLPKLTSDHVNLTPYSKMRVSLAAQVMSESVGTIMERFGSADSAGTARFILMVDKFLTVSM